MARKCFDARKQRQKSDSERGQRRKFTREETVYFLMQEFDLSSCSVLGSESEDLFAEEMVPKSELSASLARNEMLINMNRQLQAAIEEMNSQLLQAQQKADSYKDAVQQSKHYRKQIDNLIKERDQLQSKLYESKGNCKNEGQSDTQDRDSLSLQLKSTQNKLASVKDEAKNALHRLEENQKQIDALYEIVDKTKKKKKALKSKNEVLSKSVQELSAKVEDFESRIKTLGHEKDSVEEELINVKMQLNTALSANTDREDEIRSMNESLRASHEAMMALDEQISSQSTELSLLTDQKHSLVVLLKKAHALSIASDARIQELLLDNDKLRSRSQRNNFKSAFNAELSQLSLPFPEDVKNQVQVILSIDQFEPIQKVQEILSSLGSYIEEYEDDKKNAVEEKEEALQELERVKKSHDDTLRVLVTLLRELKDNAVPCEHVIRGKECHEDSEFLSYLSDKSLGVADKVEDFTLPLGFFTKLDTPSRIETVKKMYNLDQSAFHMLVAQFLLNTFLTEKVKKLEERCESEQKSKVPEEYIKKLTEQRNAYKESCKKLRTQLKMSTKKNFQLEANLNKARLDNEAMQNEILMLEMKEKMAQNRVALLENEMTNNNDSFTSVDTVTDAFVSQLKDTLEKKVQEVKDLEQALKEQQGYSLQALANAEKRYNKQEGVFREEMSILEDQLKATEKKYKAKTKLLKKEIVLLTESLSKKEADLKKSNESHIESLTRTINDLKHKLAEANKTIASLTEELSKSSATHQELHSRCSQLALSLCNSEIALTQLKQRVAREQKMREENSAASIIASEETVRDAIAKVKAEHEKELKTIYESLSQFYQDLPDVPSRESLKELLSYVIDDLSRHNNAVSRRSGDRR